MECQHNKQHNEDTAGYVSSSKEKIGKTQNNSKVPYNRTFRFIILLLVLVTCVCICFIFLKSQGEKALAQNDYKTAISIYRILGDRDKLSESLIGQGLNFCEDGQYPEAIESFYEAGEQGELYWEETLLKYAEILINQGIKQERLTRFTEAEKLLFQLPGNDQAKKLLQDIATYTQLIETAQKIGLHDISQNVHNMEYSDLLQLLEPLRTPQMLSKAKYEDLNYAVGIKAMKAGDYLTAEEFFSYCISESIYAYSKMLNLLRQEDYLAAALLCYNDLPKDLGMTWGEIFGAVMGWDTTEPTNLFLLETIIGFPRRGSREILTTDHFAFQKESSLMAEYYLGEIDSDYKTIPIENIQNIYDLCGTDPKGKLLILRSQQDYPRGKIHYGLERLLMEYMPTELFPARLSDVSYVMMINYDYNHEGTYSETLTIGGQSHFLGTFSFLRFKAQIKVFDVQTMKPIYTSPWIFGDGKPETLDSGVWRGSNLPELGQYVVEAIEMIS